MSTSKDFTQYILDQTHSTRARVKSMFGEYALYYDDKVVAFICDDTLFAKVSESNRKLLSDNKMGQAYPGSKNYYIVTEEQTEKAKFLQTIFSNIAKSIPDKIIRNKQ
jgi:TfoX/Sxy family transcriptional regulator of competence genes